MYGDDNVPEDEDDDVLELSEQEKEVDNLIELKISDESPVLDVSDLLLPNIEIGMVY